MMQETELRSPILREHQKDFHSNGRRARDLVDDLPRAALWWRPDEDSWSVGECLAHLVLAGEAYLEVIDEAVDQGRRNDRTAVGPPGRSLLGDALVHGVEPPVRIKLPAPARIQPSRPRDPDHPSPDDPDDPLARFLNLRPRYAARLEAADGLDLGKVKVRSPFVPLLRVNLDTAFRIAVGHEHRHLEQARKVMARDEFPADRPHPGT